MRQEKELLKNEIKDKIEAHGSFVLLRYKKFTANIANEFRRELDQAGGEFEVVRKRVLLKAAEDVGIQFSLSELEGHIGIVFLGSEPLETTKKVFNFGQERDKILELLAGRFDGRIYTPEEVDRLSKLPGKNEMRAQLLSLFEAPMVGTVGAMGAILTSLLYCLDAKATQEEVAT